MFCSGGTLWHQDHCHLETGRKLYTGAAGMRPARDEHDIPLTVHDRVLA
jgi:hypothetical protein